MWIYYLKLAWLSIKKNLFLSALMVLAIAVGIATCLTTFTMYSVISGNPMVQKNETVFAVQLDSWDPNIAYWTGNSVPFQLTYRDATAILASDIPDKKVAMLKAGMSIQDAEMSVDTLVETTRMTTRDFFGMFDVDFVYGGPWLEKDDTDINNVIVINEAINNRIFQGKNSVGNPVLVEGELFTVTGVVSDNWRLVPKVYDLNNGPFDGTPSMYVPFSLVSKRQYNGWGNYNGWSPEEYASYQEFLQGEVVWIQSWVELRSAGQKQEFSQFLESYILEQKEQGRFQRPLKYVLSTPKEWLAINKAVSNDDRILVGLSIAFLLVCLVNTVVMLLAKFLRKMPEAGIRRALGATRQAIFGQHILESLAIGVAGGLLGLIFSWFGLAGVREIYAPYTYVAVMSGFTIGASLLLAVGTSLFSGVLPAWHISLAPPAKYLKAQ